MQNCKQKYPGDIKKTVNGDELAGTEDNPYEINCIEDLCQKTDQE